MHDAIALGSIPLVALLEDYGLSTAQVGTSESYARRKPAPSIQDIAAASTVAEARGRCNVTGTGKLPPLRKTPR